MATKSETLLTRFTEAHGPSGFEGEVREIFVKELEGVDTECDAETESGSRPPSGKPSPTTACLLYTSDAADE